MATDVNALVRILNGYLDEQRTSSGSTSDVITKNLLSYSSSSSKDVDLDLQVPPGWQKRLDMKSGKVYLQRCNSPPISSSSTTSTTSSLEQRNRTLHQDLNCPPDEDEDDDNLDLKLIPSYDYGSVCTLDKVKLALQRADKATKRKLDDQHQEEGCSRSSGLLFAGGCPSCLMYVMISKANPKCPRCESIVPSPISPTATKKPKLDLNLNLSSSSW